MCWQRRRLQRSSTQRARNRDRERERANERMRPLHDTTKRVEKADRADPNTSTMQVQEAGAQVATASTQHLLQTNVSLAMQMSFPGHMSMQVYSSKGLGLKVGICLVIASVMTILVMASVISILTTRDIVITVFTASVWIDFSLIGGCPQS